MNMNKRITDSSNINKHT